MAGQACGGTGLELIGRWDGGDREACGVPAAGGNVPAADKVRSISCICSGVNDATSAARVSVDMWGVLVGTVMLGPVAGMVGSGGPTGGWKGTDAVGTCGVGVGVGGGASLPLFKTQIPTKASFFRVVGRQRSSKSSI